MTIELRKGSKTEDFDCPYMKITAQTKADAFQLGQMKEQFKELGVLYTVGVDGNEVYMHTPLSTL